MKNFEKYKDYLVKAIALCNSDELLKLAGIDLTEVYKANYYEDKKSLVDWLLQDYKEPILEEDEREYLAAVIRPFKENVCTVCKKYIQSCSGLSYEYIVVKLNAERWGFPKFVEGTMYKGMKLDKEYSLEELGL